MKLRLKLPVSKSRYPSLSLKDTNSLQQEYHQHRMQPVILQGSLKSLHISSNLKAKGILKIYLSMIFLVDSVVNNFLTPQINKNIPPIGTKPELTHKVT